MLRPLDEFYFQKEEPIKSYLEFLREYILKLNGEMTEAWKYGMPFFYYRGRMFCYLWVHKKFKQPYIGIVEGRRMNHPDLLTGKRAKMSILLLDVNEDIPVKKINTILKKALTYYK